MARKMTIIDCEPKTDFEMYLDLVKELKTLSSVKAQTEKREKEIKAILNKYMDETFETDTKGHRYFETGLQDDKGKPIIIKREARKSMAINLERVKAKFSDDILDEIIQIQEVEVLDEERLTQLVEQEVITFDELEEVTDVKTTYATVFVKEKEVVEGE